MMKLSPRRARHPVPGASDVNLHQSPDPRDQPLPAAARPQPGRLVSLGRGGARAGHASSTGRSSSASATRPATGATSWSTRASRTRRSPRILNEHFVSIKVDREERPDLDQIYMTAVQLLTRPGRLADVGVPHARPASRSTAAPTSRRDDRYGRPGFKRVLLALADAWKNRRDEVDRAGRAASPSTSAGGRPAASRRRRRWTPELLRNAAAHAGRASSIRRTAASAARRSFRTRWTCACCCACWKRFGDDEALRHGPADARQAWPGAASTTTSAAASIATAPTRAGWCRTSRRCSTTTPCSTVAYLEAFQATGEPFYREVVEETLDYVLREMTSPEGAVLQHAGRRQRGRGRQVLRLVAGRDRGRCWARSWPTSSATSTT